MPNCKLYTPDQIVDGKPTTDGIDLNNSQAVREFLFNNNIDFDELAKDILPQVDENKREVLRKYTEFEGSEQDVVEQLKKQGITYRVRGKEIRAKEAKAIFDEMMQLGGVKAVQDFFYGSDIVGDSRNKLAGMLYTELNKLKNEAQTPAERENYANQISDLMLDVAEKGTASGQAVNSIKDFYNEIVKNDPVAYAQFTRNQSRKTAHAKLNEGGLKEDVKEGEKILKGFLADEELNSLIDELVEQELDKILQATSTEKKTAAQKKVINDFFDSLKIQTDKGTLRTDFTAGLGAPIFNSVVELVRKLVLLGVDAKTVIERAIKHAKALQQKEFEKGSVASPDFDEKGLEDFLAEKLDPLYKKEYKKLSKEGKKGVLLQAIVSAAEKQMTKKKVGRKKATLDDLVKATITDPFNGKTPIDLYIDTKNPKVKTVIDKYISAVDELTKKLNNVSEERARRIAADTLVQSAQSGFFNKDQYKDAFARAMGISVMSSKVYNDIEALSRNIAEFNKLHEKYLRGEANEKEYKKAKIAAIKANQKIGALTKELSIVDLWVSLTKLNLLGPISLSKNIIGNIVYAMSLRMPINAIASGTDYALSALQRNSALSKKYDGRRTVDNIRTQGAYFQSMYNGFMKGIEEMRYGRMQDNPNTFETNVNLKPFLAVQRIFEGLSGQDKLSAKEYVYRSLEATLGMNAEIVARFLNLGDRPFSEASGDLMAAVFANEYGVTIEDIKSDKVKYAFENSIIEQAQQEAVMSQSNFLSDLIEGFKNWDKLKGIKKRNDIYSKIADGTIKLFMAANSPYVRIPTNIAIQVVKLKNPILPFSMFILKSVAAADIKLSPEKRYKYRREALIELATAIVGVGIGYLAYALREQGLIGGSDDDKNKKERIANQTYSGLNSLKITDNYSIDLAYLGPLGILLSSHADDYDNIQKIKKRSGGEIDWKAQIIPEYYLFDESFGDYATILGQKFVTAAKGVTEIGFFANQSAFVEAISKGDVESGIGRYATQFSRVLLSPTMPANLTFATNYNTQYKFTTLDDSILKSIANEYKKAYGITGDLPKQRTVWGEKIERIPNNSNSELYYFFGIKKNNPQQWGLEIFNKYKETGDADFLPSPPDRYIKYQGVNVKIPSEMYDRLCELVGGYRKSLTQMYMDGALIKNEELKFPIKANVANENVSRRWGSDDNIKKASTLKSLYLDGSEKGTAQLVHEFQSYFDEQYKLLK